MKIRLFPVALCLLCWLSSVTCAAQTLNIYCEDTPEFQGTTSRTTGLDIEIMSEIQKRVGNTDQIQLVPWTRGLRYLDTEPNTILFSMAKTKERADLYQWIGPISETAYSFYAKADSSIVINNLDDARKVSSIGVYRNDIRDQFLTREGFTNLDRADNNYSNFRKLMASRVTVIAATANGIAFDAKRAGNTIKDVKFLFTFLKYPIYIVASKKTDPEIVASWNAAVESMKNDGTLKAIFKKYSPDQ